MEKNRFNDFQTPSQTISLKFQQNYRVIGRFCAGGSSAHTYLVENKNAQLMVLKIANWQGIGSNGIPWLNAQYNRLKEFRAQLTTRGQLLIPVVYDYYQQKNLVYYTLEYFEGACSLSRYHFQCPELGIKPFLADLNILLDYMTKDFYSLGFIKTPKDYMDRAYANRLGYRLSLLSKKQGIIYNRLIQNHPCVFGTEYFDNITLLFSEILENKYIVINGKSYLNAPHVLERLKPHIHSEQVIPKFLPKFFHGDGLLRNFLRLPNGSHKIIDVRGNHLPKNSPAYIDISYELGKIMHSFLLEVIRENLFDLKIQRNKEGLLVFDLSYHKKCLSVSNFLAIRKNIVELFLNHYGLQTITHQDPYWLERALFAEATHFLTDAVNRLEQDSSGKHTVAYYLIGCMLLSKYSRDR